MNLNITLIAGNPSAEAKFISEIKAALKEGQFHVGPPGPAGELGHVVFVDGTGSVGDLAALLAKIGSIDRRGRALFLITGDVASVPLALNSDQVDDILVHPFRSLEVVSKLRHYRQILMWDEVQRLNESFADLIKRLQDDLALAERLQKSKLPLRFPEIKGFEVQSRYLAGMRSGGDHFDLADAKDGAQLSIVLSDSSSYGLSSAVLSALVHVAVKLSAEETRSSAETVKRIQQELAATLKEKDKLSLFYGIVSRKDFTLRYLNLGSSSAFHARAGGKFQMLAPQGGAITRATDPATAPGKGEATLKLEPNDRLALISDGFVEAAGGPEAICRLLEEHRQAKSVDSLNELVFRVKSKLESPDDMPEQDCTAVIFDVDAKILRLA